VAGGHFAGLVVKFNVTDEDEDALRQMREVKKPAERYEIIHHKTFHRYTSMLWKMAAVDYADAILSPQETGRFSINQRQIKGGRNICWCYAPPLR